MRPAFDLQGHRGARGLRPENTLPAVEAALDLLVTTLEMDLHLTSDHVPILSHDEALSPRIARLPADADVPLPEKKPRISALSATQLRRYVVDLNPDSARFPEQSNAATAVAKAFMEQHSRHLYGVPALDELFGFVAAYAGDLGEKAGKSPAQKERARTVRFNLELKRVPFRPEFIGDRFDGKEPGLFEQRVAAVIKAAGVAERVVIQSFDHRAALLMRRLLPKATGAVLIANTAPVQPAALAKAAEATIYSPDYQFLDVHQVKAVQAEGLRVVPWTVNDPADMERLLDWGVDGMITDVPHRLIPLLQRRHLRF